MTTKGVTSFESTEPREETGEAEQVEQKHDFIQILEALYHSQEVGENVFARCAKRAFRALLNEGVKIKMPEEVGDHFPVWVTTSSVTLPAFPNDKDFDSTVSGLIKDVVEQSANFVQRIRGDKKNLLLIGPLSTKIAEVGPRIFTFTIKQKWGLDG